MSLLDVDQIRLPKPKAQNFRRQVAMAAFMRAKEMGVRIPKPFRSFNLMDNDIDDGHEDFPIAKAADILLGDPSISNLYDSRYIRDLLRNLLRRAFDNQLGADVYETMLAELAKIDERWRFLVPVSGIGRMEQAITIGEVRLFRPDEKFFSALVEEIVERHLLTKSQQKPDADKVREIANKLVKSYSNECLAEVEEDGIRDRAQEKALMRIRRILAIANHFGLMYFSTFKNLQLGIKGDFKSDKANNKILGIELGHSASSYYELETFPGPHFTLDINQSFLEHATDEGLPTMLLWQKEPNEYRQAVESAIQWYVSGIQSENLEIQYVHSIIALELLLCRGNFEGITEELSCYIAVLLGADEASRGAIRKEFKRLYDIRGDIVHQGKTGVSVEDVMRLELHVKLVLKRLLTASFGFVTLKNLGDYLFEQCQRMGLLSDEVERKQVATYRAAEQLLQHLQELTPAMKRKLRDALQDAG